MNFDITTIENEEGLQQLIYDAQAKLNRIRRVRENFVGFDNKVKSLQADGIEEAELLGVIDIIYHPEHYND